MTKQEDVSSNPFEVRPPERKTLADQNIIDKNKYLTIVFFSQHYSPAARGGNLAKIPPNQVIGDFGRESSVESESE